jgi:hypothetical protein
MSNETNAIERLIDAIDPNLICPDGWDIDEYIAAARDEYLRMQDRIVILSNLCAAAEKELADKDEEIDRLKGILTESMNQRLALRTDNDRLREVEKAAREWDRGWAFIYEEAVLRLQDHGVNDGWCNCPLCVEWKMLRDRTKQLHAALAGEKGGQDGIL